MGWWGVFVVGGGVLSYGRGWVVWVVGGRGGWWVGGVDERVRGSNPPASGKGGHSARRVGENVECTHAQ